MNLTITGHHLEVTPALRAYVEEKLKRITRHFDHVIDVAVILTVEKLKHKAEVNVHLASKDIFVETSADDMYASVDTLADKLDRQVVKHKEKAGGHHREAGSLKRQDVETETE